ncbi:MAG: hypothetical protein WKF37_24970, partial [Bryobacteraceae bacterium]
AERGGSLTKVLESYPQFRMIKGEVPLTSPRIPELLMSLQQEYADGRIDTQDGLRVDWPDRWFHVRVSQTEPIVRVICEQRSEPPTALFNELMERVRSLG